MARPTKVQRPAIAQRRARAAELRTQGQPWQAIADELGYKTAGAACQDVSRALEQAVIQQNRNVDLMRQEELQALDTLLRQAWTVLNREHVTVSWGKVIYDEATGEKLLDDGPVLQAIDRILKIRERRAKLLGLDAPMKVEAITVDALDRAIAELAAELEGDQAGEAAGAAPAQG